MPKSRRLHWLHWLHWLIVDYLSLSPRTPKSRTSLSHLERRKAAGCTGWLPLSLTRTPKSRRLHWLITSLSHLERRKAAGCTGWLPLSLTRTPKSRRLHWLITSLSHLERRKAVPLSLTSNAEKPQVALVDCWVISKPIRLGYIYYASRTKPKPLCLFIEYRGDWVILLV